MKKGFIIFASLMVCLVLIFGCGGNGETTSASPPPTSTSASPPPTSTSASPPPTTAAVPRSILQCPQGPADLTQTPQYGGTLVVLYDNDPTNLGAPWLKSSAFDGHCNRYVLENLVGLDERGMPVPQLAESWVSDPAQKTVTFALRQGVKFHDGTSFNAEAVKWCLDMYQNGENTYLKDVTAIEVTGEYAIRLTLATWDALFVQGLSSGGAGRMVSPTAAQALGDDVLLKPVGTGPFKFVSYTTSVSIKYERNDDYWQKGLPYLDAVEMRLVSDSVVALTAFKKGEAHVLYGVQTSDAPELRDAGNTIYYTIVTLMGITGDSIHPDSVWANKDFREAVAYALDYKTYVDAAFDGLYPATNQLAVEGRQAWNSSIQGYPYNPDKARALLAPLGYTLDTPLEIDIIVGNDAQRIDLFTLCQDALAQVGINVNIVPVNRSAQNSISASGWENQLFNFSFSYNGFEMQWSTSAQNNLSSYKTSLVSVLTPSGFDDLLDLAKAETDMAKRETYYQQMNKLMIDDYCMYVPIFALARFTADAPTVHDFGFANGTAGEYLPERAWIDQ